MAEAVTRPASLLQPLLIGWASLAATTPPPPPPPAATALRPAMRHAVSRFDPHSATPRGVWALIAAGAFDVAALVASHMPPLDPEAKLAAAAAAGRWPVVQAALAVEAGRALHAPGPPPPGSALRAKLLAAGAGALFHGQLAAAQELFQAAGEWSAAMILAVCTGNVQAVYSASHRAGGGGGGGGVAGSSGEDAAVAGQLASALRNLYGGGGVGESVGDVELTLSVPVPPGPPGPPPEPLEPADRWPLPPAPWRWPAAVAAAGAIPRAVLPDSELGAVPAAATAVAAGAVSYYGFTATAAASVAAAGGGGGGGRGADASNHHRAGGGAGGGGGGGTAAGGSTAADNLEALSVASSDAAQAAARAEFAGMGGFAALGGGPTIDFSSDEDSGSEATGSAAGTLGGGGAGGAAARRIKIQIRDKGGAAAAAANPAAAGSTGGGLRLAPPGSAAAAAGRPGPQLRPPGPSGLASAPSASALPSPSPLSATASGPQFPPGLSSAQLYGEGARLMEAGEWRGAAAHFARAMAVLRHDEAGAMEPAARAARSRFCASYYCAVRLLEAVGGGAGGREARLYRYAAGLRLDPRHADALLREAVTRNRAAGNYRYAGDQLTALISRVADSAPAEHLAQLQAEIEECDRQGGGNKDLPLDEQVADWSSLVVAAGESGGGKEEVDTLVLPLLA